MKWKATGRVGRRGLQWAIGVVVLVLAAGCAQSVPAEAASVPAGNDSVQQVGTPTSDAPGTLENSSSQTGKPEPASDASASAGDAALDPSFIDSKTRAEYQACLDRSGAETFAMQQCGDEEMSWQDARLNRLYKQALTQLPTMEKEKLRIAQRTWLKQTDATCRWDAASEGQGQMLDAQSCRLNRTTNRADELDAMVTAAK